MRVGIYARVSTHDQQTLPMQLKQMQDYIKNRQWVLTVEFQEVGSGAKTRPKREELLKMARRREIDATLAIPPFIAFSAADQNSVDKNCFCPNLKYLSIEIPSQS